MSGSDPWGTRMNIQALLAQLLNVKDEMRT